MHRSLTAATKLALCLVLASIVACSGAESAPPAPEPADGDVIARKPLRHPGNVFPAGTADPVDPGDSNDEADGDSDSRGNGAGSGGSGPTVSGSTNLPK